MRYCFDIDGTLCSQNCGAYQNAVPFKERIALVNRLKAAGHTILLFTARGTRTGFDLRYNTRRQLEDWGVQYDDLIFGKPDADMFVDDKAQNANDWFGEQFQNRLTQETSNDEQTDHDRRDAE